MEAGRKVFKIGSEGSGFALVIVSVLQIFNVINITLWYLPLPLVLCISYVLLRIIGISFVQIKKSIEETKLNEDELNELRTVIDTKRSQINEPIEELKSNHSGNETIYHEPV